MAETFYGSVLCTSGPVPKASTMMNRDALLIALEILKAGDGAVLRSLLQVLRDEPDDPSSRDLYETLLTHPELAGYVPR